jgi:glycosyltransferase involved in cell wall biosynthesis
MHHSVSSAPADGESEAELGPYPLMVFTPTVGAVSETFIKRHVKELLPDRSATLAWYLAEPAHWRARQPLWIAPPGTSSQGWRTRVRGVARRLGVRRSTGFDAATLNDYTRYVASCRPRVVLGEYLDATLEMLPFFESMGVPVFAHGHGYDLSLRLNEPTWRRRYRELNRCSRVIIPSEAARQALISVGVAPEKLAVIPYGVDLPNVARAKRTRSGRDVLSLLMVGRMVAKKDPLLSIRAIGEVAKILPIEAHVVGDGPLLPDAQRVSDDLGLRGIVHFHGALDHSGVLKRYECADIFLQHSRTDPVTGDTEGLPVAILEAMAYGLPVVTTRHAGIPEAVVDRDSGLLVDEGDLTGMIANLLALMRDGVLRQQIGSAARAQVAAKFSWDVERNALLHTLGLDAA